MTFSFSTTSTVDFCEPNFKHSKYVAEPFNTLSSIPLIGLGAYQIYQAISLSLGKRFIAMGISILFVGLGSFLFHLTLLFMGQLADEFAMVCAGVCYFISFHFQDDQSFQYRISILSLGILYCLFFLITYLLFKEWYLFFIASFVFLVATTFISAWRSVRVVPDVLGGNLLCNLFYYVLIASTMAAVFWLPDSVWCEYTQPYQLHALWHIVGLIPPFLMFTIIASRLYAERFRARTGKAVNIATGKILSLQETAALVLVDECDPCNIVDGQSASNGEVSAMTLIPRIDWTFHGYVPFFAFKNRFE